MALFTQRPYSDPLQVEGDLDRNLSMQNALDAFMDGLSGQDRQSLERVALTVVEVTSTIPPHPWAGHRHHEMHYSASLLKVAAMYTAFDLLAAAKQLIVERRPHSADEFFAFLHSDFDDVIRQATPQRIKTAPNVTNVHILPSYDTVLRPDVNASTGFPRGVGFDPTYLTRMTEMITISDDIAARDCIHGLGYGLVAARIADDGFFDESTGAGLWLAGDYTGLWPSVAIPVVNDVTSAQATTTIDMARIYALMFDGILVSVDDSVAMLALLARAGSWFHFTNPHVWPRNGIDVTRSKVGVGPLKPTAAGIEQVVSEGITAHDASGERDFVVIWQNLKGATSFTNLSLVGRMIEATIRGFTP
jgi:hypothetical protein